LRLGEVSTSSPVAQGYKAAAPTHPPSWVCSESFGCRILIIASDSIESRWGFTAESLGKDAEPSTKIPLAEESMRPLHTEAA